jgi:hypothetical protein
MTPHANDTVPADAFIVPDIATLLGDVQQDLQSIHNALGDGDSDSAALDFTAHFRERDLASPLLTDWSTVPRNAGHDTSLADGYLAGHLDDGYNDYEVPDSGIDWDANPLSCITRFPIFPVLRDAFHHTRNVTYLRFMLHHMLEYAAAYPIDTFIDTNTVEGWINHYHVARPWYWCMVPGRITQMSATIAQIRNHPGVTDNELLELIHRLFQETAYLRADVKRWIDRRHNGGCAMIRTLATACGLLTDFRATEEWLDFDAKLLTQYIDEAFYPDGQCIEQTTGYSISSVSQTQLLANALKDRPALLAAKPKLAAMTTWAIAMSKPNGNFPSFGDNVGRGFPDHIDNPLLDWLALPWARSFLDGKGSPPFTEWPSPGGEQWSGYYTMRSDWSPDAKYLVIDGGPWGTTHQHGDRLSFSLSAFGADFIIDPTSSRYASNKPDAFLSRQECGYLHNTITVDGVDEFVNSPLQTESPLDNTWDTGSGYTHFAGSYDFRTVKPVTWERRLIFVDRTYWLLQDVLTGDLERAEIEQNFQFESGIEIQLDNNHTIARAPNGARLVIVPFATSLTPGLSLGDKSPRTTYWPKGEPHQTRLAEDGERSPSHGRGWTGRWGTKLIPAPAVTYTGSLELPAVITLALVPLSPKQSLDDLPAITSSLLDGDTTWTLPTSDGSITFSSGSGLVTN